jgi:hypothetical protein
MEVKYFESLYPEESWDKELQKIVGYIKEGNSSQLIGLPGVGRSNILGLLAYNKTVRLRHFPKYHGIVHFVMINFSEVRQRSYPDILKYMFLCLLNSLREREMTEEYEKVDALFKDALSYNDELVYAQYLKNTIEYLAIEKKLTLILLCQNFDEYIPQVSDRFFILLRSLQDKAKYRFAAIFSVARPLEEILEPQIISIFSDFVVGHTIYLPLLDRTSIEFRINYLEKLVGKKVPEKIKEELIEVTGGHMRLLIVSIESILTIEKIPDNVTDFLLSQKTLQTALMSLWQELSPSEQASIVAGNFKSHPYLEAVGLVKENKLCVPLFRGAIQKGLFSENKGKFIYDEITNTIKRGDVVCSDDLTKGEFRLFRYLLQHVGEVVERDTIISTVWKEDKSSEGISDQAIDQLLFRLRRKIEDNPNSPQFLHTLKGRGVKFSQ